MAEFTLLVYELSDMLGSKMNWRLFVLGCKNKGKNEEYVEG